MNATSLAVRSGLDRGRIELRQTFTNAQDVWGYLFPAVISVVVMLFMRGSTIPGTNFSLGTSIVPSILGMTIAVNGLTTLASTLTVEREDGTLLRAKAIPNGMVGYLIGKIVLITGMIIASMVIVLIPGLLLFDGFAMDSVGAWASLLWVVLLGLVATVPIGAMLGSLFSSPRSIGLIMMPLMALVAISGIFYPITALPEWLQWVGQVFPVYWLGLGMRSALLPDALAAVEIGDSWRYLETLGVLGAWAILGLLLAPVVLRRMARKESGSSVAARRQKAMQRVG